MDIKISGSGAVGSGEYDEIKASGSLKLFGEVKCKSLSLSGALKGECRLECLGDFKISGSASFTDSITAKNIKIAGSFKTKGEINCDELTVHGAIKTENGISANEKAEIHGEIKSNALIKAKSVNITFNGKSSVPEIRGKAISLKPKKFLKAFRRNTEANSIDGEEITLEYVNSERVSGRDVKIGKRCRVDLVEYSEKIEISPRAKVGRTVKI